MSDALLAAMRVGPQPWESPQVVLGTVGWDGEDTFVELGSAENDGFTLVRVQLFMGGETARPRKTGVGQGIRILCHVSSLIGFRVPPRGTRVLVTIPYGMFCMPGAGVITGTIERVPTSDYSESKVTLNFGTDVELVIKAKTIKVENTVTVLQGGFINIKGKTTIGTQLLPPNVPAALHGVASGEIPSTSVDLVD